MDQETGFMTSHSFRTRFFVEAKTLICLAFPMMLSNMMFNLMAIVDQIVVGHLGPTELAVAAISNMTFNIVFLPIIGFLTAQITLVGQACGAGDYQLASVWSKRAAVLGTLLCVPFSLLLFFAGPFLQYVLHQDPRHAEMAGTFCQILIPGLFSGCWFICIQNIFISQGKMRYAVICATCGNVLNAFLAWFFVYFLEWGIMGAPLATTISRIFCAAFLFVVLKYFMVWESAAHSADENQPQTPPQRLFDEEKQQTPSSPSPPPPQEQQQQPSPKSSNNDKEETTSISRDAPTPNGFVVIDDSEPAVVRFLRREIHEIREVMDARSFAVFMKMAVPGAMMLALEVWFFECATFMAGLLGEVSLDAHAIAITVAAFAFLAVPLGLSMAATVRVSNLLGARRAEDARFAARVVMAIAFCFMCALCLVMILIRKFIGRVFTSDKEILELVSSLIIIAAVFQISDGVQAVLGGILRGMGRQSAVALLYLLGLWVIGLPMGVGLAFGADDIGVAGLWWGFLMGLTVSGIIGFILVLRTDWAHYEEVAQQIMQEDRLGNLEKQSKK